MSRIVVLGAAGIIGQAIAQDLVEDVDEVIVAESAYSEAILEAVCIIDSGVN